MKLVIQRVSQASVMVDKMVVGSINTGLVVFLGIGSNDTGDEIPWLTKKLIDLRIFNDDKGKMNLSLEEVNGKILLISQFTLYANCARGKRPDFLDSAHPEKGEDLYIQFAAALNHMGHLPEMGIFGADMKVSLLNDGPVTIILER
jgi:D-aminoacyl-tRNA deacylase